MEEIKRALKDIKVSKVCNFYISSAPYCFSYCLCTFLYLRENNDVYAWVCGQEPEHQLFGESSLKFFHFVPDHGFKQGAEGYMAPITLGRIQLQIPRGA